MVTMPAKPVPTYQTNPTIAVLLVNLGTPDAPTVPAVRQYLRQFLSDTRVIEVPKLVWAIILNLFILTTRPKRVAHAYASVWDNDSPLRQIAYMQADLLQQRLDQQDFGVPVKVELAMTYGKPALTDALHNLKAQGIERVVVLPAYPQYSASTTAAVFDVIAKYGLKARDLPALSFVKDYYNHPLYIAALADSVRRYQAEHGQAQKLLFSFHGIPKPYADKGDPYPERCKITAHAVAAKLGLTDEQWAYSFQSRFGLQEWVKPYTDELLTEWGKANLASVQILSPAFSADCLETLEELAVENKNTFQENGGGEYGYIPALNTDPIHIDLFTALVLPHVQAWATTYSEN